MQVEALTARIRRWLHLSSRFFQVRHQHHALSTDEVVEVGAWLRSGEDTLFFSQPPIDQQHGLTAARTVAEARPGRIDLIRAALLHDIGKRHSQLPVWGRVLGSLGAELGLPLRGRFLAYRDHGPIAARELEELGAEPIVSLAARHHHEPQPPPGVDAADWSILRTADGEGR